MKKFRIIFLLVISVVIHLPQAYSDNSRFAVILIDMQYGFYERGEVTNTPGLQSLVHKQMDLLRWATQNDIPVIVYEFITFGKTDQRLISILEGHDYTVIEKITDGAFDDEMSLKPSLKYLEKFNVDSLIVAGINGGACVVSTINGAIHNNFNVIISSDLIGDLNVNPPTYPNDTWYGYLFGDKNKYVFFKDLEEIIN